MLFSRLTLALACAGITSTAAAAGFQLSEQSVTSLGRAHAGAGIMGDDLSAAFYNPAGMLLNKGTSVQAGIVAASVRPEYEGSSTNPILGTRSGTASGNVLEWIPNGFMVHEISPDLRLGLSMTAPFGLATDYDDNWIGNQAGISSSIKTVDINPSIGWQATPWLALGAGVSAQYANASLKQGIPGVQLGEVKAKGWAWGYNLGAMVSLSDSTRLGLAYRSKIDHKTDGFLDYTGRHPSISGGHTHESAKADVTVPEYITLSAMHEINPQWTVSGIVRWTNWSRLKSIDVVSQSDKLSLENNWGDSWYYGVGADYRHNDQWTFRGGLAYETTPVKSAEYRNPLIPDSDRGWVSLGASWKVNKQSQLDFSYSHLFAMGDSKTTYKGLNGEFSVVADLIGVQYQYQF
ncbi:OmpP1/FadL family transporter [Laribacter hongkongensis]|uniref:OmpP1/FadL family transporter n=1 Tax=Laribacter hongkongensis TaxID=168471 RepID=UPI0013747B0F|nr:OmpP1/FadL family transporter [Laribacter hongkongensis]MCG9042229.1 OmpP1/FadL family transporter [Laribacter hongkongensis]MCG9057206.1 OmpP1/FadL family transporter [Laribacter hongkongensis]MCG9069177.1 OmpP1/FadL family transporter [Laribacter hongkongensis]MCG9090382.1 OmpP1/FadL family transporter [Laribacter hongkongensis]MCG9110808.1 OmpP1/FadL family transporter [Laribacter hongkongensis]